MRLEVFTYLGGQINNILNEAIENVSQGWIAGLLTTAKVGITLYITFYGYLVLAGKKNKHQYKIWFGTYVGLLLS